MSAVPASNQVIESLRRELLRCQVTHTTQTIVSSGFPGLDRLLPQAGLPSGAVIEWLSDACGLRSTTVALQCAAGFLESPGTLAVVDPYNEFHVMSLPHSGIPLSRLLLVRPCQDFIASSDGRMTGGSLSQAQRSDALWTLEQLARCAGVRIVMMWVDRLSATAQRRLQLAVERSGVTVFLMRPKSALRQTSWADLRFHVQSEERSRISVRLVRSKNSVQRHGKVLLDYNHETGDVFEAAELADSVLPAPAAVATH